MKKIFIILSLFFVGMTISNAQEMRKGMGLANVGVGFVPGVGINFSYDYGLVDTWGPGIFTVGGFIGWANYEESNVNDIRGNDFFFSPRATYRYAINSSFEVYGTVMFGAKLSTYSKIKDNHFRPNFSTTAGCRYTFAGNISVFAELGYNVSCINGGLSISF